MRTRILPLAIAAAALLSTIHSSRAENLVQNGDFASGLTGWTLYTDKETAKGTHEAAGGVFKLTAPDAGAQPHVRQLLQPVRVEPGKRYELSFEARNDGGQAAEMVIVLGPKVAPGQRVGFLCVHYRKRF